MHRVCYVDVSTMVLATGRTDEPRLRMRQAPAIILRHAQMVAEAHMPMVLNDAERGSGSSLSCAVGLFLVFIGPPCFK